MSGIPTPMTRSGGSRLPGPSSLPRPGAKKGVSGAPGGEVAAKRPRGSVDLEEGQSAKRTRTAAAPAPGSLSKAKSMMNIAKTGPRSCATSAAARVARPLPGSMMSGRATMAGTAAAAGGSFKRPGAPSRPALNDRSNLGAARPGTAAAKSASASDGGKKKRQPWDLKGRLEDMERMYATTNQRVAQLEQEKDALKDNVEEKETMVVQNSQELTGVKEENARLLERAEKLRKELEQVTEEGEEKAKKLKRSLEELEFDKSALERRVKALEDELCSQQEEVRGLKTTVSQLTSASAGVEAELKATKRMLEASQEKCADLTQRCSRQEADIEQYQEKERAFETERRRLHNTIQELKGNIRVFCRLRPLLGEELTTHKDIKHIDISDERSLALIRTADSPNESVAGGLKGKSGRYDFEFDRVFGPSSTQSEVFDEISQLVQSAIDGYNVCVFAYGQTGSGKTFTMEGGEEEGQEGMIPKTIEKIFEDTSKLTEKGWSYKLEASFLEIYNEEIRDLLATEKNLKYDIKISKEDAATGGVKVTNLRVEEVKTPAQISALLRRAHKNRAVAATNCNERSSRSHSVFQLRIAGSNSLTTEACSGMLNLVDLAGSERLKDSGSEGARLTETKNINKSLANLGNVIMALAQKDSHVPYRNSKLTHVLQGSLGGNSKTLMFVNVSPREEYLGETLNSLRFATKVNQCHIGTATKKVK